ncbi:hypothetical protein [Apilactobacillus xinyiensis]|uniref:hypothetical protein n=1 Tax=Apilactobacillus xinyiensis TaxID=2841032 RepID=UPI00200DDAC2|nr:hypothetical protein [Apilactobacillus xinyiensis]MCL0318920.1 hypothetical protein [Apilactobacillus xinyiensis]
MSKTLKKSLYLSLAALSFITVSGNKAKADSNNNVTATYSVMYTDRADSNVLVNANNAIYTKPGTMPGAKLVASRDELSDLTTSSSDKNTFFVYQMAKTSRGSYYAKVVTMDKRYRGWIYAGKQDFSMNLNNIGGGLNPVTTLGNATMPDVRTGYTLKNQRLWTAPYQTSIDAKRINLAYTNYTSNDTFTIDRAARNRAGWLYYHVYDANNPSIQGWVYYSALGMSDTSASTGYTLNFSTDYGNTTSFSKTLSFEQLGASSNTPASLNMYNPSITNLIPAGYHIDANKPFTTNDDQRNLTKGGKATVNLVPNSLINLNIYDNNNNSSFTVNNNAQLNTDFNNYFNLNTLNSSNSYRYITADNLHNFINVETNKGVITFNNGYALNRVNGDANVSYTDNNVYVNITTNKSGTTNY